MLSRPSLASSDIMTDPLAAAFQLSDQKGPDGGALEVQVAQSACKAQRDPRGPGGEASDRGQQRVMSPPTIAGVGRISRQDAANLYPLQHKKMHRRKSAGGYVGAHQHQPSATSRAPQDRQPGSSQMGAQNVTQTGSRVSTSFPHQIDNLRPILAGTSSQLRKKHEDQLNVDLQSLSQEGRKSPQSIMSPGSSPSGHRSGARVVAFRTQEAAQVEPAREGGVPQPILKHGRKPSQPAGPSSRGSQHNNSANLASLSSRCEVVIKTKPARVGDFVQSRILSSQGRPMSFHVVDTRNIEQAHHGTAGTDERARPDLRKTETLEVTRDNPLYSYIGPPTEATEEETRRIQAVHGGRESPNQMLRDRDG